MSPGAAARETVQVEEDYGQDCAQEEGGKGRGDVSSVEACFKPFVSFSHKSVVDPNKPADVPNDTDCHVDPCEFLTETNTTTFDLGEGEEGEGGEEEEGGMAGDDLEGALTAQVEGE